jgi:uncharacterized protein YdcH (DUF465 family)
LSGVQPKKTGERRHPVVGCDAHFAKLADQYEEVDKHICRAEDAAEGHDEDHMHKLKAERLRLKDEVFKALQAA